MDSKIFENFDKECSKKLASDTNNIYEYYEWKNGLNPNFLYSPLVKIVDACKDIDFCNPSDEKWEFAKLLLTVLEKNIKQNNS